MNWLWFVAGMVTGDLIGVAAGLTVGVLVGFFTGIVCLYNAFFRRGESEEQCGTKDENARR